MDPITSQISHIRSLWSSVGLTFQNHNHSISTEEPKSHPEALVTKWKVIFDQTRYFRANNIVKISQLGPGHDSAG